MCKVRGISFPGSIPVLGTWEVLKLSEDQRGTNPSTRALAVGSPACAPFPADLLGVFLALVGAPHTFRSVAVAGAGCPWFDLLRCGQRGRVLFLRGGIFLSFVLRLLGGGLYLEKAFPPLTL